MKSVMQEWVSELTFMQQSVLITAVRGPDNLPKEHISKTLLRWYRRCILYSAMEHKIMTDPYEPGGGSFCGPCKIPIEQARDEYLRSVAKIDILNKRGGKESGGIGHAMMRPVILSEDFHFKIRIRLWPEVVPIMI